jgi:phenylpyruvate tautomerase PptA (4-oxalocrotonate tautomerase family)
MPMVDVELVVRAESELESVSAQDLADDLGDIFRSPPGRTWVRLVALDTRQYAENRSTLATGDLPAFVTVLHARPPEGAARAEEVMAITLAVARVTGRPPERVHVRYAPAATGRQAFGGTLVE